MRKYLLLSTLIALGACGATAKAPVKIVNDEVSTPMTTLDVESTDEEASKPEASDEHTSELNTSENEPLP
ncbi:MAG: hypothetical protein JKY56_15440 [Kofleriaceae bacterium]|nr:hypothetical protein [Kofleriaceae bacterium]